MSDITPDPITPTHWVCVDCLMVLMNGDSSGIPDEQVQTIEHACSQHGNLVYVGDEDTDQTFSRSPCDCCRSPLGGSRHAFLQLER